MDEARRVHLDSAKLRCLAHPLRSRLLSALRVDGPATSAALAQRLGTNTGATSYHLRQLAEVQLITDVPARGTARERWWQAAHEVTSWSDVDFQDDPDDRAAAEWLMGHHTRTKSRWVEDWLEGRGDWSQAWRRAAGLNDMRVRLTPAQTTAMYRDLAGVIERYHDGGPDPDADPDEVADVIVSLDIFPTREVRL